MPPCDERIRLQTRHDEAAAIFDAAREALIQRIGVCPKNEFRALNREVDRAWTNLRRVRIALSDHLWAHMCFENAEQTLSKRPSTALPAGVTRRTPAVKNGDRLPREDA